MKITRQVTKVTHANGSLVYRRIQKMPVGIKIRELSARIVNAPDAVRSHAVRMEYNGQAIVEGMFDDVQPVSRVFDPPLPVPRGTAEFRVVCTGFNAAEEVTAAVTIDVSVALFG